MRLAMMKYFVMLAMNPRAPHSSMEIFTEQGWYRFCLYTCVVGVRYS